MNLYIVRLTSFLTLQNKMKIIYSLILLTLLGGSPIWASRVLTGVDARSLEANIISVDAESVLVERASDGAEFTIPLSRLVASDQDYLRAWKPEPIQPLNSPVDGVVIIRTSSGMGSGFFVNVGNRTYVYTNQHVIGDMDKLEVIDSRGEAVEVGSLEVSNSQDLARFQVKRRSGFVLQDTITPSEKTIVLGNSLGAGVVTTATATVKGIGPDEVEVDADFVPGNSGGPIVNQSKEVIGVATYIKRGEDQPDWVKKETRYAKARRFALRPSRVDDWKAINREDYAAQVRKLELKWQQYNQAYWTFIALAEWKGYLSTIPTHYNRDLSAILKNHNARQKRPDSTITTTYYSDGYTSSSAESHREKKEASKRTNFRALDRFLEDFGDLYRLRETYINVDYLKNGMRGADELLGEIRWLRSEINKELLH